MIVARNTDELRDSILQRRLAGDSVGFVPTMGMLHAGQLSLVKRAREENGCVVVSSFVNPHAFRSLDEGDGGTRDHVRDLALLEHGETDIVAEVGEMPADVRPFLIGFAAESDDLEANATGKLRDKGLDLIVGNVVGGPFDAIGSDENKVTVFGAEGPLTDWPMLPKRQVAERLWDLIDDRYRKTRGAATAEPGSGGRRPS